MNTVWLQHAHNTDRHGHNPYMLLKKETTEDEEDHMLNSSSACYALHVLGVDGGHRGGSAGPSWGQGGSHAISVTTVHDSRLSGWVLTGPGLS